METNVSACFNCQPHHRRHQTGCELSMSGVPVAVNGLTIFRTPTGDYQVNSGKRTLGIMRDAMAAYSLARRVGVIFYADEPVR